MHVFKVNAVLTLAKTEKHIMTMSRSEIVKLLKKAENGDIESQFAAGTLYKNGGVVIREVSLAKKWYKAAAMQGDTPSLCQYAFLSCEEGNHEEAYKWYLKGAQLGSKTAAFNVGRMHEVGFKEVSKDLGVAIQWYKCGGKQSRERLEQLAAKGVLLAQQALVELKTLKEGQSSDIKHKEKLHAFTASDDATLLATINDNKQQYETKEGQEGVFGDSILDKTILARAQVSSPGTERETELTISDIIRRLGELSSTTITREHSILAKAFETMSKFELQDLLKKAEKGDIKMQYIAGKLYEKGKGVIRDREKAREWYEKAAEKDYVPAQCQLALLCCLDEEYELGHQWYLRAYKLGSKTAIFKIGFMYESGNDFVPQNRMTAIKWYKKAAELGNLPAQQRLEEMAAEMKEEVLPKIQAVIDLKITAETETAVIEQAKKEKAQLFEESACLLQALTNLKVQKKMIQTLKNQDVARQTLKAELKEREKGLKEALLEKDRVLNEVKKLEEQKRALEESQIKKYQSFSEVISLEEQGRFVEEELLKKTKVLEEKKRDFERALHEQKQVSEQLRVFEAGAEAGKSFKFPSSSAELKKLQSGNKDPKASSQSPTVGAGLPQQILQTKVLEQRALDQGISAETKAVADSVSADSSAEKASMSQMKIPTSQTSGSAAGAAGEMPAFVPFYQDLMLATSPSNLSPRALLQAQKETDKEKVAKP